MYTMLDIIQLVVGGLPGKLPRLIKVWDIESYKLGGSVGGKGRDRVISHDCYDSSVTWSGLL